MTSYMKQKRESAIVRHGTCSYTLCVCVRASVRACVQLQKVLRCIIFMV